MSKKNIGEIAGDLLSKAKDNMNAENAKKAAIAAIDGGSKIASKAKGMASAAGEKVVEALDENGNGEIDIEDIIVKGLRVKGIKVDRESFLRAEFKKNYSESVITDAILTTPARAGIPLEEIDKIADEVIKYERNCVSGISAVLGAPGGAAMLATIPTDIIQYYGYMIRAAQKLMYLYGFPEINVEEDGQKFDSETINVLTICLGVMYGVAGAGAAIRAMAKALATGVEKKLLGMALTKGTIYPIVKSISSWFGKKMTKAVFAGFFKKSIPVVGVVVSGGLTYASFKPCCDRLKASLRDTKLSNPTGDYDDDLIIIDVEEN